MKIKRMPENYNLKLISKTSIGAQCRDVKNEKHNIKGGRIMISKLLDIAHKIKKIDKTENNIYILIKNYYYIES